ncbi:outer membrane protein assembly factor BamB family protein [Streptomyces sp. NPDC054871]
MRPIDARTGRELWTRPTQRGTGAMAPETAGELKGSAGPATVATTNGGVLTAYGDEGSSYALLGPDDGKPVWQHPFPRLASTGGECDLRSAGDGTRIIRLDPATGKPSWTATARDELNFLGQTGGRLLFTDPSVKTHRRIIALDLETRRLHTVYLASPSGRIAALDRDTGEIGWTRAGRGASAAMTDEPGAPLTLVGDALYVPYGTRSVFSIDVRNP